MLLWMSLPLPGHFIQPIENASVRLFSALRLRHALRRHFRKKTRAGFRMTRGPRGFGLDQQHVPVTIQKHPFAKQKMAGGLPFFPKLLSRTAPEVHVPGCNVCSSAALFIYATMRTAPSRQSWTTAGTRPALIELYLEVVGSRAPFRFRSHSRYAREARVP